MHYLTITGLLFICMLIYFKIACKYHIIDKPNERSSHAEITLRAGGIIFPIAYLFFMAYEFLFKKEGFEALLLANYGVFGLGLLFICSISFIDDLRELSTNFYI